MRVWNTYTTGGGGRGPVLEVEVGLIGRGQDSELLRRLKITRRETIDSNCGELPSGCREDGRETLWTILSSVLAKGIFGRSKRHLDMVGTHVGADMLMNLWKKVEELNVDGEMSEKAVAVVLNLLEDEGVL
jgi:hypothetical protein